MTECSKVSIIMGIYNCAATLPDAIESIVNQTYTNWQLIMCDDCSTDDTYQVAESYVKKYPDKMILIRNEQNMRLAYSLNQCLKYADGEYIARMDGDDISLPERFEKEMSYLQEHPEVDLVGCDMQYFNDQDGIGIVVPAVRNPNYYTLRNSIPYHHATIMCHRKVYDRLNGYTVAERTKRAQDYDLWFRFYHAGFQGNNIPEALYLVREDDAAIRRRTFKVRWNAYKTTRYGFRLLGYPKRWLIKPFLTMLLKGMTPFWAIGLYRKWQAKNKSR